jgi:DNA-binding transcriptional LysR family regulator
MFAREMRAFHSVALTGSIRQASRSLGVAPSSVSRQIALLEHQMGTSLLRRTPAGVVLTHAGSLVAEYARGVVLDYDSLRADLNDLRGSRRRLIRVAAVESSISGGLLQAIAEFRLKFSSVSFRVSMLPALDVVDEVRHGECDIGLAFGVQALPDISVVAKIPEPIVLVVPVGHEFATLSSVALRELKGLSLALPDIKFGIRRIVDSAMHDIGLGAALHPALSANTFIAIREFVKRNAGVAILPRRAVIEDVNLNQLVAIPIEDPGFDATTIDIIMLSKQRTPRVIASFIDLMVRTFSANTPIR